MPSTYKTLNKMLNYCRVWGLSPFNTAKTEKEEMLQEFTMRVVMIMNILFYKKTQKSLEIWLSISKYTIGLSAQSRRDLLGDSESSPKHKELDTSVLMEAVLFARKG